MPYMEMLSGLWTAAAVAGLLSLLKDRLWDVSRRFAGRRCCGEDGCAG